MNQLLLGALLPFAGMAVWYARRGRRASLGMLLLTPLLMALGALYAVAPDLPRLAGRMDLYYRLADDPRTNIFLWHYAIDRIEVDSSLYHAALVLTFLLLIGAAWRELYLAERR